MVCRDIQAWLGGAGNSNKMLPTWAGILPPKAKCSMLG